MLCCWKWRIMGISNIDFACKPQKPLQHFFLLVKSSSYVFEHCAFHGIALLGKRWIGEQQNCTLASWQVSINDKTKLKIGTWPSTFRLKFSVMILMGFSYYQTKYKMISTYVGYFLLSFPWVMLKIILWIIRLC